MDSGEAIKLMGQMGFLPVFEGKHVEQYIVGVKPIRWWLSLEQMQAKYNRLPRHEPTLVFRDTARNTDERTCIAAVLPHRSAASYTLTGLLVEELSPQAAAVVLNSFCFDFALRLRTAGTHISMTYISPMPVPAAEVVMGLPMIETRQAWQIGVEHVSEDKALWPALWEANRAVAEAYSLTPDDFEHILSTFPVFARKRPSFFAYLFDRVRAWKEEALASKEP